MNGEILNLFFLIVLFAWLIVAGRLFCGKVCPAGYVQDLLFKIPFFIKIKKIKGDKYIRFLKYFIILINFLLLPLLAFLGLYQMAQNDSRVESPIIIMVAVVAVIVIAVIINRPFCKYICPVGAVSSLFNKFSFYKYKTLNEKCIQCGICVKKCKMDIIPYKTKNSLECIRCGYCKKVCPKDAIITGFNMKRTVK